MRFLARYGRYAVCVQPYRGEAFATGQVRELQKEIVAQFAPGGMQPLERELAIGHWGVRMNGHYQEMDEVTIPPPDFRIGVFDSEQAQAEHGWSNDEREHVERTLVENGRITGNVLAVPLTVHGPPWPRYDDYTGTTDELVRKLIEEGYDLAAVLDYEKANQRRPDVVSALTALADDPDAVLELMPEEVEIA